MKIAIRDIKFYAIVTILSALFVTLMLMATKTVILYADSRQYEEMPTVIVDAGHGGEDGGSTARRGELLEKDVNLAIAKDLNGMLQAGGYTTVMTREEDISIHDSDEGTMGRRKISDLKNRVNIANAEKNTVLISIHQNEFSDSKYYGTQIFYSKNDDRSKNLAECMRKEVVRQLQPNNKRPIKVAGSNIYLMDNVKCPAVLVECGFLSNPSEAQKLGDESYQKEIAFVIYSGFVDYWKTEGTNF